MSETRKTHRYACALEQGDRVLIAGLTWLVSEKLSNPGHSTELKLRSASSPLSDPILMNVTDHFILQVEVPVNH